MITYFKIAAAMIGLLLVVSLGFQLYLEYSGVLARAAYAPGLGFIGISHFGRATYAGVSWYQDFQNPGPCPLVIHLPDGDLSEADLASIDRLRTRGFEPDLPDAGTTAMLRGLSDRAKGPYQPLPPQYVRWDGRLLISLNIDPDGPNAGLHSLWVGYQMAEPQPWPRREGIVSVGSKRLPLPITNKELAEILGPPLSSQQGWP